MSAAGLARVLEDRFDEVTRAFLRNPSLENSVTLDHARDAMMQARRREAQALSRKTFSFTWHGEPLPKPRPRVARTGGVYVSKRYAAFEQELAWAFKQAIAGRPLERDVTLDARFYRKSTRRSDGDNFLKALLDSGQGIAWVDDSQVIDVHYRVSTDPHDPRIEVRFGPDSP